MTVCPAGGIHLVGGHVLEKLIHSGRGAPVLVGRSLCTETLTQPEVLCAQSKTKNH